MEYSIEQLKAMTRTELEALRDEINHTGASLGEPTLPYSALAAIVSAEPYELPVSNPVFCIAMKCACGPLGRLGQIMFYSTEHWLHDEHVKGICIFPYTATIKIIFLTEVQFDIFKKAVALFNARSLSIEEIYNRINTMIETLPDLHSPTKEELNISYVKAFFQEQNSESLEVLERTSRFSGATWFEEIQKKVIVLAGLGGIGSYVCFLLARMQPTSIFLYDDDIVEAANMSGQLYGLADIGSYKVDAMAGMVSSYANYNSVFAFREKFTETSEAADIMICGFDSMNARETYFRRWLSHVASKQEDERSHCLFIDGRLSAEYFQVFCITGDDAQAIEEYQRNRLFKDAEADETVCSYKQTTYMANMIGSVMVNLFTNFVANEVAGAPIRELPYFTSYDGNSMQFKLE